MLGGDWANPLVIEKSSQATIATWAVKTALLLNIRLHGDSEFGRIASDNLRWLYDYRDEDTPPPGCKVWIAGVDAQNIQAAWSQAATLFADPKKPQAYFATFAIGYLVLQVLGRSTVEADRDQADPVSAVTPHGLVGRNLIHVWPATSTISWPPPNFFRREALQWLASWPGRPGRLYTS